MIDISTSYKGFGKLTKRMIDQIMLRKIYLPDGREVSGISKNELLAYIYMTQICNPSGYICDFLGSEISDAIGCSRREVFYIFNGLEKKGFIKCTSHDCMRDIQILNCEYNPSKKERYINTFVSVFDFSNNDKRDRLSDLSLYSLKLLIYLIFNHSSVHDYTVLFNTLMRVLGIKTRALISSYLKELDESGLLVADANNMYRIAGAGKYRKYGILYFKRKITDFITSNSDIGTSRFTYYKRKWYLFFKEYGIVKHTDYFSKESLYPETTLANYVISALKSNKLSITACENYIRDRILNEYMGVIDAVSIARLGNDLYNLAGE